MLADLPDNWQHDDVRKALGFVRRFDQAVDGGAHRGIVTRLLLTRFAEVVAIEPGALAEQIPSPARVVRAAIADRPGRCALEDGQNNTGERHVVPGDDVDVTTLDALNLTPDFIKLDIEGLEYQALLGGSETILTHRPVIMLEDKGHSVRYGVQPGECRALLENWGARMVATTVNHDQIFAWQ